MLSQNFDETLVRSVVYILRDGNNSANNCMYLANDLLKFFETNNVPNKPSLTTKYNKNPFYVYNNVVKNEFVNRYDCITQSTINRDLSIIQNIPYNTELQIKDGVNIIDADPIYVIDNYNQPRVKASELNKYLMREANDNLNHSSFGFVTMARCGNHINLAGHIIVYFSNPNKV